MTKCPIELERLPVLPQGVFLKAMALLEVRSPGKKTNLVFEMDETWNVVIQEVKHDTITSVCQSF